ncbi:MAG: hypothetical protein QOH97_1370 [Actinoplanes sp.]|jgi:hypothetical protein|nr:hypothetical protein [Actinoplanes sp.]
MRRFVFSIIVVSGLVMIGAGPAPAEPAATVVAQAKAAPGKKMCKIASPLLNELSGMVATESGYIVMNDSTDLSSRKRIFFLNQDCGIDKSVSYSGAGPRDTEDMVLSADGKTLWISDAGDNNYSSPATQRQSIGLWTMPVSGSSQPRLHRLTYPNGEHHDSEALLLTGNNTPVIVTKEAGKPAAMYEPAEALKTDNAVGVPMKKVGEFQPPDTSTAGTQFARLFRQTVTGGAIAPAGNKIVLRTYTDAYEWDVANGDVVGAVKAKPRQTPLENEPFGEAITYSPDGKFYYTVSDMQGTTDTTGDNVNYILRYTPAVKVVTASTTGSTGGGAAKSGAAWYKNLTLDDITYIVAGVGVLGAILVGLGVLGIVRFRKTPFIDPRADAVVDGGPIGPRPTDAPTELLAVGGPPPRRPGGAQRPGVYGGARSGAAGPSGPVYGATAAPPSTPQRDPAPQRGGGVYGGAPQGGRPTQPPGRPAPGGGRPLQGVPPTGRPPHGGQQGGRPQHGGQPVGRPPQGGPAPGRSGVYGTPPPPPPPPGSGGRGQSQRPSGILGQGDRADMNAYRADRHRHDDGGPDHRR